MKKEYFLILILLLSTNFLSLNGFGGMMQKLIYYPFLGYMTYYLFTHHKTACKGAFEWILGVMIVLSLFSSIPCYLQHGQPILQSVKAMIPFTLAMVCYWFMLRYRPTEKQVIKAFTFIALAIFAIQSIQQFFPYQAMFGVLDNAEYAHTELEQRNGLYRFRVGSTGIFTFPVLFLAWVRVLSGKNTRQMLLLLAMLASIYLMLTRQIMATTLITLFLGIFLFKLKPNKWVMFAMYVGMIAVLVLNFDAIFGSLVEQSAQELDNDNYIRFLSGEYFLNESLKSPMVFFFGHSVPSGGSAYDKFINDLGEYLGFYSSDVGAIGAAYVFGYIYTAMFYVIVYYVLVRYRKSIPAYLQMSVLAMTIYSIMIFNIRTSFGAIGWSMLLYLCDLHINRSPLRMADARVPR